MRRKKLAEKNGSSMIEMIAVMLILVLLGAAVYTLIFAGSSAQQRINENMDTQIGARIAVSYLNVSLRQSDGESRVSIRENPLTGEDALVIRLSEASQYYKWIYFSGGKLYEYIGYQDETPNDLLATNVIAQLDGFKTELDAETNTITNTVYYTFAGESAEISQKMLLKAKVNIE